MIDFCDRRREHFVTAYPFLSIQHAKTLFLRSFEDGIGGVTIRIHIVMKDIATLDAAVDLVSKLEACEHAVGYNASFYRYN